MVSAQLGGAKERTALTNSRLSTAAISCDALAAPDSVISTRHGSLRTWRQLARAMVACGMRSFVDVYGALSRHIA